MKKKLEKVKFPFLEPLSTIGYFYLNEIKNFENSNFIDNYNLTVYRDVANGGQANRAKSLHGLCFFLPVDYYTS